MNYDDSAPSSRPTLAQIFNYLLQVCRDEQGKRITVQDIALQSQGINVDNLYHIKQGRNKNPGMDVIEAICKALKVPPILLMPDLWGMEFRIPESMPGFAYFPTNEQFTEPTDEP